MEGDEGGSRGGESLHKLIIMPPLRAELLELVCDWEEEQLRLINHNGN